MLVCPVFQSLGGHVFGGPVYPGGIGILLTLATRSVKDIAPLLDFCADCKKCEEFCPVGIPTPDLILKLKSERGLRLSEKILSGLFRKKSFSEKAAAVAGFIQQFWQQDGYLRNLPFSWARGKSFPLVNLKKRPAPQMKNGAKVYVFEGCMAKFFFPEIRDSVLSILAHFDFYPVSPSDQVCCGAPSLHLGHRKDVQRLASINLKSIQRENPDCIVTVCPTGNSVLKKLYPEILGSSFRWKDSIFDFTEFMVKKGLLPEEKACLKEDKVFYHFPCHYLNALKLRKEPEKMLRSLGFNPIEEEEPPTCCGFCGIFSLKNPEVSARIWEKKKEKILSSQATLIATDCPGCLFQLRASLRKEKQLFKTYHSAELYARVLEQSRSQKVFSSPKNRREKRRE
jgi:Fe-S oxidoreductase